MSVNQEDLQTALSEVLGGQPSSEEGLDYARRIMNQSLANPSPDASGIEALRTQQEGVLGALQAARSRLMEARGTSDSEFWLALGRGLGQSTKTGSIGETASNVAGQLLPIEQADREFAAGRDAALNQLDLAEAQAMGPVTQAELDLSKLQYQQQQQNMREALKTISRSGTGSRGSAGSRTREAKIADLMNEWHYDRRNASALVDGFVDIEIVPNTGMARLINEIDKTVVEVPLGSLGDYVGPDGQVAGNSVNPPSGSPPPGETDTRTDEEKELDMFVTTQFKEGRSLYDMAEIGSGPIPSALAGASIPSSVVGGPVAEETLIARQGLRLASKDLVNSLVDNPRLPVRLVELALESAGIEPSVLTTGPIMQSNMVALDAYLYQKYLEFRSHADDPNAPQSLREDAATNALGIGNFLKTMGVPQELRRRSPFVPTGAVGNDELPELSSAPPAGMPQSSWDTMSPAEKMRYRELVNELSKGSE